MIKRTISKYLHLTSVKGIPRLLKTKSRFMKLVWGVSIGCFLMVAAYQAIILTQTYLSYSTVTSIRELPLDLIGMSEDSIQLPDATFCNLNPFASNFTDDPEIPSIKDYITEIQEMTVCDNCTVDQELVISQLLGELMTTRGYYVHIGSYKAKTIGHNVESLLVSCHVLVKSGMHLGNLPCKGFLDIVLYQDSRFFNCFTLKSVAEQTKERIFMGLTLVFHLDDYAISNYPYALHVHPQIGFINGMVFTFHDKGTPPVLARDHMLLQPGLFLDWKLRVKRRKRLPKPYGRCVVGAGKYNEFIKTGPYSQFMCFSLCRQKISLDRCGCIDYDYHVDVLTATDGRPCLKLGYGRARLLKEWECVQRVRNVSATTCTDNCQLPCDEITFIEKATQTSWPAGQHRAFYQEYISDRSYASQYKDRVENNGTRDANIDDLRVAGLMSKHFLALQIYLDQTTMMEYTDQPHLSLIGFFSQLGGALNLWAGITCIVIIELVELLFELIVGKMGDSDDNEIPTNSDRKCSNISGVSNDSGQRQDGEINVQL